MADAQHVAKVEERYEAWNEWRANQAVTPDLSGANLRDKSFVGKNVRDVNFTYANLSGAIFGDGDLRNANLRGANLRDAVFKNCELAGASLRETNLQVVDLSVAKRGLQTEQLAGADLTGATLPEELKKLYDGLENVNNISESARKLFLAVLAACLYSWLTIATTTDVNLITNRASSPLPIIQTSIPIVGFYWVAPLLLLCVYFYLHFYLQKLWEELGSLPAIFPDGRPLHSKIDPWLLNDLVRAHLPKLSADRPFLSYLQLWISVLLAWWVVPITMFLFWGRYLPRHERSGTTFHVVLLAISVAAALRLYWLAVATMRGAERGPFRFSRLSAKSRGYQAAALVVAVGLLFGIVSWGAIMGEPSDAPILGIPLVHHSFRGESTEPATWIPRLMALVGYFPFANLADSEISQKRPTWSKNDKDLESVAGARLRGANLRYAAAPRAFLAGADLTEADLSYAYLEVADLTDVNLTLADLTCTDLRFAQGLYPNSIKGARHWEKAIFDDKMREALAPNSARDLKGKALQLGQSAAPTQCR